MTLTSARTSFVALIVLGGCCLGVPASANATNRLSLSGYGPATWGMTISQVEQVLDVTFDCSGGAVPGECLCPEPSRELPVVLAFDPTSDTLSAAFSTSSRTLRTSRGVRIGTSFRSVRRRYPGARLVRRGGVGGGLAENFLLARDGQHSLVFTFSGGRVQSMTAGATRGLTSSELCA